MQEITLPKVIFGTSGLGNLYVALPDEVKLSIVNESVKCSPKPAVFDSAGKYGAGLALEALGRSLKQLKVSPSDVLISNKLGWLRTELKTAEPTFEPGIWRDLKYDAVQKISYEGILECYKQGNELLGGYHAELVSVHDPDEYLAAANDVQEQTQRYQDILDAYQALNELKEAGRVKAIGVGAKNWRIIKRIAGDVELDWVMIANSMTMHDHPVDLIEFMKQLSARQIVIINSAVFNGGFLTGLDYYNYQPVSPETRPELYRWRETMYSICEAFDVRPEAACVAFGKCAPGVRSIALNTTNVQRVAKNAGITKTIIPEAFWRSLVSHQLIDARFAEEYLYE